jgi:predicted PurR-regulated permease PerM
MVAFVAITILSLLLLVQPALVTSQQIQPSSMNMVIRDVLRAEMAGAQPEEIGRLAAELNSVLSLESQLQNLAPQEVGKRTQLLGEINNTLANVDAEANQFQASSSHQTFIDRTLSYVLGAVGAMLATLIFLFTISLQSRYRAKRTLRMKISPK